jgi:hypothetical protein
MAATITGLMIVGYFKNGHYAKVIRSTYSISILISNAAVVISVFVMM